MSVPPAQAARRRAGRPGHLRSMHDAEARLEALESTVTQLSASVATLTSHATDNVMLLTQLQERSMELSDRVHLLEITLANVTSTGDDVSNETTNRIAELQEQLQRLHKLVNDVMTSFENVTADMTSLRAQVETNRMKISENEALRDEFDAFTENVTSLVDTVAQQTMTSCTRRALLIDGSDAQIGDDDVTASSEANDTTASKVRIRSSDSAWCSEGKI